VAEGEEGDVACNEVGSAGRRRWSPCLVEDSERLWIKCEGGCGAREGVGREEVDERDKCVVGTGLDELAETVVGYRLHGAVSRSNEGFVHERELGALLALLDEVQDCVLLVEE
jgi:hypothetical protein